LLPTLNKLKRLIVEAPETRNPSQGAVLVGSGRGVVVYNIPLPSLTVKVLKYKKK